MSKLLWAGMAGFLCGMKYREAGHTLRWKRMKRQAERMMRDIKNMKKL